MLLPEKGTFCGITKDIADDKGIEQKVVRILDVPVYLCQSFNCMKIS